MAFWKFIIVLIALVTWRCNDEAKEKETAQVSNTDQTRLLNSGIDIEPALLDVDSIEVIYYDDPNGDSLRYSRFFSFTTHTDTAFIQPVLRTFQQQFTQYGQALKCRSEGKMFLHKSEVPVKTIYFSSGADSCSYLYFIKNGNFFYFPLPREIKGLLSSDKKNARKPG